MNFLSSLPALLFLVYGWTQAQQFRVVDADSGQPLQGVTVTRFARSVEILSPPFRQRLELPKTDAAGVVTVDNIHHFGRSYNFAVKKEGYENASVVLEPSAELPVLLASPAEKVKAFTSLPPAETIVVPIHRHEAQ